MTQSHAATLSQTAVASTVSTSAPHRPVTSTRPTLRLGRTVGAGALGGGIVGIVSAVHVVGFDAPLITLAYSLNWLVSFATFGGLLAALTYTNEDEDVAGL